MQKRLWHLPDFFSAFMAKNVFPFTLGELFASPGTVFAISHQLMAGLDVESGIANFAFNIWHIPIIAKICFWVKRRPVDWTVVITISP